MDDDASFGVVVTTHGDGHVAGPLLAALIDQGVRPASIALVQNPTATFDPLPETPHAEISIIRTGGNFGYSTAMNTGIRHHLDAGCATVLLLTHEVAFRTDDAVATLRAAGRGNPAYGVLGPAVWWRSADRPYAFGGTHGADGVPFLVRDEAPAVPPSGIVDYDWIDGCAMLVRREVFDAVGLFDERFFLYFEETDFCLRARRAGWPIGVVPASRVEQEPGVNTRRLAYAYLLTRNGLEYARRRSGGGGVRDALRVQGRDTVNALRVIGSPRTTRADRQQNVEMLAARSRGVVDFARRRWGPPPAALASSEG